MRLEDLKNQKLLEELKEIIECYFCEDDLRMRDSIYNGRSFHQGVAVTYYDESSLEDLKIQLQKEGLESLATAPLHRDSMGLGMVASWDINLFS